MKIISHGNWIDYTPAEDARIKDAPSNAVYCKRESDGIDWYTFQKTMNPNTIKCQALKVGDEFIIGPATKDASRLFPARQFLFEVEGFTGGDPQAELGGKVVDTEALTIREKAERKGPNLIQTLQELSDRIAKLENR